LIQARSLQPKIVQMISNGQRGSIILVRATSVFPTITNLISTIRAIMNFRPRMVGIKSDPVILSRMVSPGSTASFNWIHNTRRKMRDHIMTVGNSEMIGNVVHNCRGEVEVTDSWRTKSVQSHSVSANDVAHRDIQSSMGSKSASQTVASKEDFVVTMLVEKLLEVVEEVASEVISVFDIEVIGGDSVLNRVETVGSGAGFEGFFGELGESLSSTESNDDFSGAIIDKEGVRNGFGAPESVNELVSEIVATEVVAGLTAVHVVEVFSLAVRGSGGSEKSTSKAFIVAGLNGNKSEDRKENKEGRLLKGHLW